MGVRGPIPDPNNATGKLGRPSRRPKTTAAPDVTGSGRAPKTLGPVGRRYWRQLAGAAWLNAADRPALERLCLVYQELEAFREIIAREGAQVGGSKQQPVAHPLLAVIDRSRASADRLEVELGLTPLARQRMHLTLERPHTKSKAAAMAGDDPRAQLRLIRSVRDRLELA